MVMLLPSSHSSSVVWMPFPHTNVGAMYGTLTSSQVSAGIGIERYIVFDYCLFWAITKLNEFNEYKDWTRSQIYCGSAGTAFDYSRMDQSQLIEFKTYTCFSMKPSVATMFQSDSGLMLVLNDPKRIVCADISWISDFPKEFEVLVRRHCGTTLKAVVSSNNAHSQAVLLGPYAFVNGISNKIK